MGRALRRGKAALELEVSPRAVHELCAHVLQSGVATQEEAREENQQKVTKPKTSRNMVAFR